MGPARFHHLHSSWPVSGSWRAPPAAAVTPSLRSPVRRRSRASQFGLHRSRPATSTDAIYAADGPTGVSVISAKTGKMVSSFGAALGGADSSRWTMPATSTIKTF